MTGHFDRQAAKNYFQAWGHGGWDNVFSCVWRCDVEWKVDVVIVTGENGVW